MLKKLFYLGVVFCFCCFSLYAFEKVEQRTDENKNLKISKLERDNEVQSCAIKIMLTTSEEKQNNLLIGRLVEKFKPLSQDEICMIIGINYENVKDNNPNVSNDLNK